MKLEEARKLATEYDKWDRGDQPRIGNLVHTVAWVDARKVVCRDLKDHCNSHFDEVVAALEMCIALANCSGDACSKEREILARAKEVKVSEESRLVSANLAKAEEEYRKASKGE